jgi:hypothetical protein
VSQYAVWKALLMFPKESGGIVEVTLLYGFEGAREQSAFGRQSARVCASYGSALLCSRHAPALLAALLKPQLSYVEGPRWSIRCLAVRC